MIDFFYVSYNLKKFNKNLNSEMPIFSFLKVYLLTLISDIVRGKIHLIYEISNDLDMLFCSDQWL